MSEWSPDREDAPDPDRIALDGDAAGDLDEALQEAVEAVEAATAGRQKPTANGGDGPGAAAAEGAPAEIEEEAETAEIDGVATLRAELEELRQRSTRTLADFDNYRKRVEREKQAQERYNGMEVLRGLLDIVDNLERALASQGPVEDLKTGVEMTLRQTEVLLKRHGVARIEADGVVFDPAVHEAVSRHEDDAVSEPQVTAVLQSGYQMHERLLRPARVAVAVPAAARPAAGEDADNQDDEEA